MDENAPIVPPPWTSSHPLRVIPLGGLGEVGMNNMVYEVEDAAILVDCGVMFPDDEMLGVDLVIPDWQYLHHLGDKFIAVVITHGHEDHIGALPYLLRQFPYIPIYTTRFTRALIENRLSEHTLEKDPDIRLVDIGGRVEVGPFSIHYIRVNHSIPDACALAITTDAGTWIHTGDFKIDPAPPDGERMDFTELSRYGREGVLALLSDSTNAEREGYSISEREVGETIRRIFADAPGRVILSTFSSNIYRIQQVIDAGHAHGRKLLIEGRSMVRNTGMSADLGYLNIPAGMEIRGGDVASFPPDRLLILTTGSQGEPLSALVRMASGEHKFIRIADPDTVILSSKFIPGNERAIGHLINQLSRKGANVIYYKVSEVHVSGHASREELKMMLNLTLPKYFIPVHGEYRQLMSHAKLARELGWPAERVRIIEDGAVLGINDRGMEVLGRVPIGRVFVDGKGIGDVGDPVIRDRKHLSEDGIVIAMINIDRQAGTLLSEPIFMSRGFVDDTNHAKLWEDTGRLISDSLMAMPWEIKAEPDEFRLTLRRLLTRHFRKVMDRHPMVIPIVSEM